MKEESDKCRTIALYQYAEAGRSRTSIEQRHKPNTLHDSVEMVGSEKIEEGKMWLWISSAAAATLTTVDVKKVVRNTSSGMFVEGQRVPCGKKQARVTARLL